MGATGHERVDSILEGMTCPRCGYSLRGLAGESVTCPECGQGVNVQAYVEARWKGAWFNAPLYNMLALPLTWALAIGIATLIVSANVERDVFSIVLLAGVVVMMAGWIPLLVGVTRRFGSIEGLWLALLAHLTVPGYLGGFVLFMGGVVGVFTLRRTIGGLTYPAAYALAGVAAIVLAFGIERFIAKRCIRRHLRLMELRAAEGRAPPTEPERYA